MPVSSSGVVGCRQKGGAEYGDKERLDCQVIYLLVSGKARVGWRDELSGFQEAGLVSGAVDD